MELQELRNMVGRLMGGLDEAEDDGSGEETSDQGIFKFTSKTLRLLKQYAGLERPIQELLNFQRKILGYIDPDKLLGLWSAKDKTDLQDLIMHNPKRAMALWMKNLRRISPKIKKVVDANAKLIPVYYWATIVKAIGDDQDTADALLKKHFMVVGDKNEAESEEEHMEGGVKEYLLSETYAQNEMSRLDTKNPINMQLVDWKGKKTRWMNLDNEVVDALNDLFKKMQESEDIDNLFVLTEQNSKRGDLEARVWKKKHKNYKMIIQRGANKGKRAVVHLDKETGTATLSPLDQLSVAELMHMLVK